MLTINQFTLYGMNMNLEIALAKVVLGKFSNALKEKLESFLQSNNLKINSIPKKLLFNKEKFKFCKSLTIIIVKLYQLMSFNNKNMLFNTRLM